MRTSVFRGVRQEERGQDSKNCHTNRQGIYIRSSMRSCRTAVQNLQEQNISTSRIFISAMARGPSCKICLQAQLLQERKEADPEGAQFTDQSAAELWSIFTIFADHHCHMLNCMPASIALRLPHFALILKFTSTHVSIFANTPTKTAGGSNMHIAMHTCLHHHIHSDLGGLLADGQSLLQIVTHDQNRRAYAGTS